MHKKYRGMTLIEVMVALSIVAISLMAASKAYSLWIYGGRQLQERVLAHVCAQNTLAQWRLSPELPAVGDYSFSCEQDGLTFQVQTDIRMTSSPKFRRASLRVVGPTSPGTALFFITTAIGKV